MTMCLYLPDGRVAFMFRRPQVTTNDAFDAAGMRFEVVEPFVELAVSYAARRSCWTTRADGGPAPGIRHQPPHPVRGRSSSIAARRRCSAASPTIPSSAPARSSPAGTTSSWSGRRGTVEVGDEQWELDGFGLRDHSWGPRYWQAPWYYRWLTGNVGDGFGFMGSRIARRDGPGTRGGFVWDGRALRVCHDFRIRTTWEGDARATTAASRPSSSPRPDAGSCTGRCCASSPCATAEADR